MTRGYTIERSGGILVVTSQPETGKVHAMKALPTALILALLSQVLTGFVLAQDLESAPPVVVKTVPEAGSNEVAPGAVEIRISFSKPMMDQSWSWVAAWKESTPAMDGMPKYEADHKTCVIKVKLEPGKTYGYWINAENFHGFMDEQRHPAVPYLLVFKTKGA